MQSEAIDYRYLPPEPEKTAPRLRPRAVHGANGTFMAGALCPHCQRHAMTGRHILADAPCPVCAKRPSGK
jgi:hypothetical protein